MTIPSFVHLHVHSQYSILDGATPIKALVQKAKKNGMPAVALTDHGVMFGSKLFYDICNKEQIKPIIGCEAYVTRTSHKDKLKRSGDHLIILAKNLTGYKNLIRLVSIAHTEGFYYRPRIDKALLKEFHEGLIICSACIAGEIPRNILDNKIQEAEEIAQWYKNIFGDDFYLEIMLHPNSGSKSTIETQEVYQKELKNTEEILKIGAKLNIKVVATNDVHFLNAEDADAHEILLCLNTGKKLSDEKRMRYTRQEWFKTSNEMQELFGHIPEVLENTLEVANKVEEYILDSAPIMPIFPIPDSFGNETEYATRFTEENLRQEFGQRYDKLGDNGTFSKVLRIKFESDYLQFLTQQGAQRHWPEGIPGDIQERINFELETIKTMGFPGYFLIVQDFINAARNMGVIVGPGRGSAAGSVVAYCLGITGIDPTKYDLLFERFLNPDRISMPDIDIDFDDNGRQKVLDWVTQKYGRDHVAHIVTFGSMAPKSAIKDVARVIELPLPEANRLAKLVPSTPKITMLKAYNENKELEKEKSSENPLISQTMVLAESLDGSIRQTGIHACGILISRDPLTETIPVMPTPNEELLTTQYDGHFVEPIGLLKMDFLGLKTLSIIKSCLQNIKQTYQIDLDINKIPLDDIATYDLFSKGETTALFQFESAGMKKHLRNLKPNRFEDLVAMNALYRPGPMEYIPTFIARKHGKEEIKYDHPLMEQYLKATYGITVYQEQVMLQSRALGKFTRGESDSLRKAMGKKKIDEMEKLQEKFIHGCLTNPEFMNPLNNDEERAKNIINKIWTDWKAFAAYAFNKSHSVCYAYIAYQTGYLKAHYPVEFMAAVMTSELGNAAKIAALLQECERMGITVHPPCVNRSDLTFNVDGPNILFGLAAIRGVGESASQLIIDARNKLGKFTDLLDFCEKTEGKLGKKVLECLAKTGGFDNFGIKRSQLVAVSEDALKLANTNIKEKNSGQSNLFAFFGAEEETISTLSYPQIAEWSEREILSYEKELLGVYVSGHPIGEFLPLLQHFELHPLDNINSFTKDQSVRMGGYIAEVLHKQTSAEKGARPWAILQIEGLNQRIECLAFPDVYEEYKDSIVQDAIIMIEGVVTQDDQYQQNNNQENDEEPIIQKKIFIKKIIPINKIREIYTQECHLRISSSKATPEFLTQLHQICENHQGEIPLKICLIFDNKFAFLDSKQGVKCDNNFVDEINTLLSKDGNEVFYKNNRTPPDFSRRHFYQKKTFNK